MTHFSSCGQVPSPAEHGAHLVGPSSRVQAAAAQWCCKCSRRACHAAALRACQLHWLHAAPERVRGSQACCISNASEVLPAAPTVSCWRHTRMRCKSTWRRCACCTSCQPACVMLSCRQTALLGTRTGMLPSSPSIFHCRFSFNGNVACATI